MWRKENDRKQSESNVGASCRVSVRSDNSHPNNGTGCSKDSFHCSIVPSDMRNSTGQQGRGGTELSWEAAFRDSEERQLRVCESGREDGKDGKQWGTSINGRRYL